MMKTSETDRKLADWLNAKYLEWRARQDRKHASLTAFATYIGIKEPLLNALVNNRRAGMSQETADKIALALDDDAIYDLVDLPRPDPYLRRLTNIWHRVSEDRKQYLLKQAEDWADKDESKTAPPKQPMAATEH